VHPNSWCRLWWAFLHFSFIDSFKPHYIYLFYYRQLYIAKIDFYYAFFFLWYFKSILLITVGSFDFVLSFSRYKKKMRHKTSKSFMCCVYNERKSLYLSYFLLFFANTIFFAFISLWALSLWTQQTARYFHCGNLKFSRLLHFCRVIVVNSKVEGYKKRKFLLRFKSSVSPNQTIFSTGVLWRFISRYTSFR